MEARHSDAAVPGPAPERAPAVAAAAREEAAAHLNPSGPAFWFGLGVVLLSMLSALVSYLILTGLTAIAPRNEYVWTALAVNVLLILTMLGIIVWQAVGLSRAWKKRVPGARLHIRIVALFSLIAALPAVLLAVAATTTFSRSLDGWFSGRTRAIVENSYDVAKAYVDEHNQIIRTDIVNMVRDINGESATLNTDADAFQKFLIGQAGLRDLTSAYIIDAEGVPTVLALDDPKLPYVVPPQAAIQQAESGQVALSLPSSDYRMSAIAKIDTMPGRYLYVARGVSPKVISHLLSTEQNVYEYSRLRQAKGGLKVAHGLIYFMISMTSLLAAIWVGMWFAGRFVAPIRRLIAGAQEVSKGNLEVALPERRGEGDLRRLSETFNLMTRELKSQQDALHQTNTQLTERHNFIEAVLSGVSAGVIGMDSSDRITLLSRSAERLLGLEGESVVGKTLAEVVPEFAEILAANEESGFKSKGQSEIQKQIGDEERTFAVKITHEKADEGDVGSVLTFDDVSELVLAQRTSAWADIARRIAHEIKNPLTPIQLSAERLRRKFGKQVVEDHDLFETLTQTIERQTGQIKSMVDEFASFARMPQPVITDQDLRLAVQEPAILFREGHKDVDFKITIPDTPVRARFDLRLVSQAVTNLIKNAAEAIESYGEAQGRPPDYKPAIEVRVVPGTDRVAIEVIDNGIGLPKQNRAKLLEPYVTTRAKGTGLGLAIVQKVVEQHNGALSLEDAPLTETRTRGALVRLTLPIGTKNHQTVSNEDARAPSHVASGA
ncbi:PAS domain-containing sensor histidine kinase [Hyphomicrobium methylovorum]|uniref:sensor histidine kinase NtrY-like n=1 Tax=Hyphomicrobium methylovorum TaxID=84 RepID=UPI0015E73442|nr:PAS domain-containing sensor histidine kinase [Hyphomicrobium methylovorum]MBA2127776.1 PAS domain-containing sensor histidine kinase [Hyphomicrobium methylovorum]